MPTETWAEYVRRVTQFKTQSEVAALTGLHQGAISRWSRGDTGAPRAESVVAFARALNVPPVEALIAAGYITAAEAGQVVHVRTAIGDYSDAELLEEVTRRMVKNTSSG